MTERALALSWCGDRIRPLDRIHRPRIWSSRRPGQISMSREKDGVVIVDHGSRRSQSNQMLEQFVEMYRKRTGRRIVEAAHMELASPTIEDAFDRCVGQGAERIIVAPYFLFPGRHWDKDIPALVAAASSKHPGISYLVTAPIGLHELMVLPCWFLQDIVEERMDHCVRRAGGEVEDCDVCAGTGRCKQMGGWTKKSEES